MVGRLNELMVGWMDRKTNGLMDGYVIIWLERHMMDKWINLLSLSFCSSLIKQTSGVYTEGTKHNKQ